MSFEKAEKYEPTPEEVEQARNTMTDAQHALTFERVASANALEAKGVKGHLERGSWKDEDGNKWDTLEGELDGHIIKLRADAKGGNRLMSEFHKVTASGTVDGKALTEKEAVALWDKYAVAATPQGVEAGEGGMDEVVRYDAKEKEKEQRGKELGNSLEDLGVEREK
jgi:hypothetical protein